jgi:hypothetical protein
MWNGNPRVDCFIKKEKIVFVTKKTDQIPQTCGLVNGWVDGCSFSFMDC